MNIAIIGSTQYKSKFMELEKLLVREGHEVKIPAFDDHPNFDELEICKFNRDIIKWADKIYVIWDGRSLGTVFDFGMVFALGKPISIQYIEPKTFAGVMIKYAKECDIE